MGRLLSFSHATLASVIPTPSKLSLPPLPFSDETSGQRLARLGRERGFTQVELAERTGLVQTLVSDYERGKLRLNADMILRCSTDDLLQPSSSRRVPRRLERIEALPMHEQSTVLKSLDLMLKNVAPAKREEAAR